MLDDFEGNDGKELLSSESLQEWSNALSPSLVLWFFHFHLDDCGQEILDLLITEELWVINFVNESSDDAEWASESIGVVPFGWTRLFLESITDEILYIHEYFIKPWDSTCATHHLVILRSYLFPKPVRNN